MRDLIADRVEDGAGAGDDWRTTETTRLMRITRLARIGLALGACAAATACSVSEREEREIGSNSAAEIDSQLPVVEDTVITRFVERLGGSMTSRTSRADLDWRFAVMNVWPVNAAALPGGFVYVTRGLIEQSDRLDELAGVMAHEVAHVVRRHSVKQIERSEKQNVGLALLCTLTGACRRLGGAIAVQVGLDAQSAQYSQSHEAEADSVAVVITRRAGIDPEGLPRFLEKVLAQRAEQPTPLEAFFASHPTDQARIAALRRQIASLRPAAEGTLLLDTPEYQAIRERVRALPLPPPPYDTLGAPTRLR
jgi:predicted Zn-dependent protease